LQTEASLSLSPYPFSIPQFRGQISPGPAAIAAVAAALAITQEPQSMHITLVRTYIDTVAHLLRRSHGVRVTYVGQYCANLG